MESVRRASTQLTTLQRSFRSSSAWIIFVVSFSVYTDQFLYTAIVPVTPFALAERGHISEDKIQYWTTILLAVFGAACFLSSPPWAWFTDNSKNRRRPFLLGLLCLLGATVMLWLAPNVGTQVAGRVLQGTSSAVVWTTGFAVLADSVDPEHIGEASGYIGIALDLGSVTAPMLGGIVFKRCGYNAVFAMILGVIVLDIVFRMIMKEPQPRQDAEPVNPPEVIEASMEKGTLKEKSTVQITEIDDSSSTTSSTRPLDSNTKIPTMIRLLFSVRFVVALWGVLTLAAVFSGFETILPTTVHALFGWDSDGAGLMFLPLSIPALTGPLLGKMTDKYGGRWFLAGSFLVLCPALVLLRLVTEDSMAHKVLLCSLLFIVGCCLAIIPQPLFSEVAQRSEELSRQDQEVGLRKKGCSGGYYGQAYGYFNMAWSLGNTVGPLLCGFIVESRGWATATLALGLLSGLTTIPVVLYCDGWWFSARRKSSELPEIRQDVC